MWNATLITANSPISFILLALSNYANISKQYLRDVKTVPSPAACPWYSFRPSSHAVSLHTQVWAPEARGSNRHPLRSSRLSSGLESRMGCHVWSVFVFWWNNLLVHKLRETDCLKHHQKGRCLETSRHPDSFHAQTYVDSAGKCSPWLRFGDLYSHEPSDCQRHVGICICAFLRCSFSYFCRYSVFKYASIALVSVGIFICTFMSAKQVVRICSQMISIHYLPWGPRYLLMI